MRYFQIIAHSTKFDQFILYSIKFLKAFVWTTFSEIPSFDEILSNNRLNTIAHTNFESTENSWSCLPKISRLRRRELWGEGRDLDSAIRVSFEEDAFVPKRRNHSTIAATVSFNYRRSWRTKRGNQKKLKQLLGFSLVVISNIWNETFFCRQIKKLGTSWVSSGTFGHFYH